jgi:hypothetical protein
MRKGFVVFCWIGLVNTGLALACDIENKQEIHVGGSAGVAGKCSNNGDSIQCLSDGEGTDSLTCNGPEGNFSGPNLQALISTACGCGAEQNDGATEQLHQELGNLPQD